MNNRQRKVWRLTESLGINDLPINYKDLIKQKRIKITDYEAGKDAIERLNLQDMCDIKLGFSATTDTGSYIFIKHGLSKPEENHVLAHELGHFEEGHNDDSPSAAVHITPEQEKEAEEYPLELAPTPVLYLAGISTVGGVKRVTDLDDSATQIILARITEYANRDFIDEEWEVCKRFESFIKRERKWQRRNKIRKVWMPAAAGAVVATVITVSVFLFLPNRNVKRIPIDSLSSTTISEEIIWPAPTDTSKEPAAIESTGAVAQPNGQTVYWLASGEVYHMDRNCQHIRTKQDSMIRSGTIEESGKARACKSCG